MLWLTRSVILHLTAWIFTWLHDCSLFGAIQPSWCDVSIAVHHIDGKTIFKDHCYIICSTEAIDIAQCSRSEIRITWRGLEIHCSSDTRYVSTERKPITPAQEMRSSKIVIISTAILRREAKFNRKLQNVSSYERAFEEDYTVCFVDACGLNISNDVM